MKKQSLFAGVMLAGFGAYFLLQQYFTQFSQLYSWPSLLIIAGVAFLFQAYGGKDWNAILPGVILAGLGLHFHIAAALDVWPDHAGIFLLVLGLGFLLSYVKTGTGLFPGILFFASAVLLLFFEKGAAWAAEHGHDLSLAEKLLPFLLLGAGIFFIMKKGK